MDWPSRRGRFADDCSQRRARPTRPRVPTNGRLRALALVIGLYALTWLANRSLRAVSGDSMLPGLWPGDHVAVVPARLRPPRRGDVVVVVDPRAPRRATLKRVVGLPGETVTLDAEGLRIDGVAHDEPYASPRPVPLACACDAGSIPPACPCDAGSIPPASPSDAGSIPPASPSDAGSIPSASPSHCGSMGSTGWVVPPGCLVVLGDNRAASTDSRTYGPVPTTSVLAVALLAWAPRRRLRAPDHRT